jgi:hypothetical protein
MKETSVRSELTPITAKLSLIPGVVSVSESHDRMVVEFSSGLIATVARSPLSAFTERETFDVWLPSTHIGCAADVAPNKSRAEVITMLTAFAAHSITC